MTLLLSLAATSNATQLANNEQRAGEEDRAALRPADEVEHEVARAA